MKTITEKRQEAFNRLVASTYENSRAKRNGKSKQDWEFIKNNQITYYKEQFGMKEE